MRPTKALISAENLKKNYLNIRKKVGCVKIMAVVKADAYGHNVKFVVQTLNSLGNKKPDYYAVATIEEGIELKKIKVPQPVVIFDLIDEDSIKEIIELDLITTVCTDRHIEALTEGLKKFKSKRKIKVHVNVDTGMKRLGVDYQNAFEFVKKLSAHKQIIIDGIYTHFATSDEAGSKFTKLQIKRFDSVINKLKDNKIKFGLVYTANSGAILDFPETYYDMVRPGISLYGYYPSLKTSETIKLYPVMSVISKVGSVKIVNKGESISYGRKYFTKRTTKIVTIPMGYADGFSRNLTNKAQAIIKGKLYNQVGTVTMDRIMIDVGMDNIKVGDDVILIGKNGKLAIDAWDWSEKLNTIPYEITCGISKRVPRILIK